MVKKNRSNKIRVSFDKEPVALISNDARRNFSKILIRWYEENKRELPWRNTNNPYHIWLSEIILQQTRVAQGIPYYEEFLKHYPTVFTLAKASEQDVLRLWQGLGYYTRARNLHQCAIEVVEKHKGKFPQTFQGLQELKGIGSYTAAAIASIAFGEPVAVVDGNVFRVLSRIFGIDKDISDAKTKAYFFSIANTLIPKDNPNAFNQAIMEFGATHCLPRNPLCTECPFKKNCIAKAKDLQSLLPIKSKKPKVKKRYFYYFVIRKGGKILMKQRKEQDIWKGLFDFYLMESTRATRVEKLVQQNKLLREASLEIVKKQYKHVLSHQQLITRFVTVKEPIALSTEMKKHLSYQTIKEIRQLPKPTLIVQFLKDQGILE